MERMWWYYLCSIRYEVWCWRMATPSKESLMQTMDSIITDLHQQGLVDEYFRMSEKLKNVNGPYFFASLLPTFINDTRNAIRDMTMLLEEITVDFNALDQIAIKLRGSCSCIGVCRVAGACSTLRQAAQNKNKQECIQALKEIRDEFGKVHSRIDAMIQLESQMLSL